MKIVRKIAAILLILIILPACVAAQEYDPNKVHQQRNSLSRVRKEIEDYRNKIKNEKRKEKEILDNLEELDREIDLTHTLIAELKKEENQKKKAVDRISNEIHLKQAELEIYKKRMVSFYKYGRVKDIELLLTTQSFNKTFLMLKYLKLIADNDRRNYFNILKKKRKVEDKKAELKNELISKRKIINEKVSESERLKTNSEQRNKLLTRIQQNKKIYLEKLSQYQVSAKEIEKLIVAEEQKRLSRETRGTVETTNFPALKGSMMWPVQGFIINGFGRHKHPRWKTITENIGIDIKADFGAQVKAVASGIVTAITWQRGRGNIIIINHGGGYFSVYTHLSQILVQIDQQIKMGQVVGNVGDTGSLQGPMLHFEIWKSNQYLNPETWLN
ncbi:hypothetical protein B6I21_06530 [candidate division KSB1 bacterium 4572_119]|nr:MAG: hypothetical protein B6I21_06530 [candidate division KSB1 bacterium 4572_119]